MIKRKILTFFRKNNIKYIAITMIIAVISGCETFSNSNDPEIINYQNDTDYTHNTDINSNSNTHPLEIANNNSISKRYTRTQNERNKANITDENINSYGLDHDTIIDENVEEVVQIELPDTNVPNIEGKQEISTGSVEKFKRGARLQDYAVTRSYINSTEYPVSQEIYFTRRFPSKDSKKVVKKSPIVVSKMDDISLNRIDYERIVSKIKQYTKDSSSVDISDELTLLRKQYAEVLTLSKYCCSYGYTDKLKNIGVKDEYIFKFMIDDKKLYELQSICMLLNNSDIATLLGTVELAVITRDIRDNCICRNKEELAKKLSLFKMILDETELFEDNNMVFIYTNELNEVVKNNITRDVKNILETLQNCP